MAKKEKVGRIVVVDSLLEFPMHYPPVPKIHKKGKLRWITLQTTLFHFLRINQFQTYVFLVQGSAYHLVLYKKNKWKPATQKAPASRIGGWDGVSTARGKLKAVEAPKARTYRGRNQEAKH